MGGVLHRGQSLKDLDLFFSPLNKYETNPREVLLKLCEFFGSPKALRDSPDYQEANLDHWTDMYYFMFEGRRIDVFIQ